MSLFAEGIRSSLLPCSYSVLLIGVALVLLRKGERLQVLGVFAGFTVLSAWIRAAGISNLLAGRLVTSLLVVGGLAAALLVSSRKAGLVAAAFVGAFAGATWLPCVGEELGTVLTSAQDDPGAAVLFMAVYLIGVMVPLVAVAALLAYVPVARRWADGRLVAVGAGTAMAALAVLVLTDFYDSLLSTLARWSV